MTERVDSGRWINPGVIAGWAVVAALVAYYVVRMWSRPGNFEIFYVTGQRVLTEKPIYQGDWDPYLYAPFFAIILSWFARFPYEIAKIVWMFVQVAATVGACVAVKTLVSREASRLPAWFWWVTFAASFQALELNVLHLQVNGLVFLAALMGLLLLAQDRHLSGGALLGFAATIKLTALIFLPYLAVRRRWRALGATIGAIAFWLLAPALWFGWKANIELLGAWRANLARLAHNGEYLNDSLAGLMYRVLSATPYTRDGRLANQFSLSVDTVAAMHTLLAVGVIALVLWWTARRVRTAGLMNRMFEWAMLFLAALLISPTSWKHHYVPLVLAYAVLGVAALRTWPASRRTAVWTIVGLVLVTLSTLGLWGSGLVARAHFYGLPVAGVAVLMVALGRAHPAPEGT